MPTEPGEGRTGSSLPSTSSKSNGLTSREQTPYQDPPISGQRRSTRAKDFMFRAGSERGVGGVDSSGKRAFRAGASTAATAAAAAAAPTPAPATAATPRRRSTVTIPKEHRVSRTVVPPEYDVELEKPAAVQGLVNHIKSGNPNHGGGRQAKGGRWMAEEDQALREIVHRDGVGRWKTKADLLNAAMAGRYHNLSTDAAQNGEPPVEYGRAAVQCLHSTRQYQAHLLLWKPSCVLRLAKLLSPPCKRRWQKVLQPGLNKGPWTSEEDAIVKSAVGHAHVLGMKVKWSDVADQLCGRIGKQCRERWFNHLDPTVKKTDWTSEEDEILFNAQMYFGPRWCEITKLLPGRTENAIKNRFNSSARERWRTSVAGAAANGKTSRLFIEALLATISTDSVLLKRDRRKLTSTTSAGTTLANKPAKKQKNVQSQQHEETLNPKISTFTPASKPGRKLAAISGQGSLGNNMKTSKGSSPGVFASQVGVIAKVDLGCMVPRTAHKKSRALPERRARYGGDERKEGWISDIGRIGPRTERINKASSGAAELLHSLEIGYAGKGDNAAVVANPLATLTAKGAGRQRQRLREGKAAVLGYSDVGSSNRGSGAARMGKGKEPYTYNSQVRDDTDKKMEAKILNTESAMRRESCRSSTFREGGGPRSSTSGSVLQQEQQQPGGLFSAEVHPTSVVSEGTLPDSSRRCGVSFDRAQDEAVATSSAVFGRDFPQPEVPQNVFPGPPDLWKTGCFPSPSDVLGTTPDPVKDATYAMWSPDFDFPDIQHDAGEGLGGSGSGSLYTGAFSGGSDILGSSGEGRGCRGDGGGGWSSASAPTPCTPSSSFFGDISTAAKGTPVPQISVPVGKKEEYSTPTDVSMKNIFGDILSDNTMPWSSLEWKPVVTSSDSIEQPVVIPPTSPIQKLSGFTMAGPKTVGSGHDAQHGTLPGMSAAVQTGNGGSNPHGWHVSSSTRTAAGSTSASPRGKVSSDGNSSGGASTGPFDAMDVDDNLNSAIGDNAATAASNPLDIDSYITGL